MPQELGTNDMGESGDREHGGREIGASFTEAAMRVASKNIKNFF